MPSAGSLAVDGRVPAKLLSAEFRGMARAFRNKVRAVDVQLGPVFTAITKPLQARLRRQPVLRHEQDAGAIRDWRVRLPALYRIGEIRIVHTKRVFEICETRIAASRLVDITWDEPGISLTDVGFRVEDGKFTPILKLRVNIGIHAFGRCYERCGVRADADLIAEIIKLDVPIDAAVPGWLGDVETVLNGRGPPALIRNVRSWFPAP